MTDILAVGELLVDLTQTGTVHAIPQYAANPGGAPANVAVAAARLGAKTAFCGKIGRDNFGSLLRRTLQENGVDDTFLYNCSAPTTLAVVSVDEQGERSFTFYREKGADTQLNETESRAALACEPCFLHFGSVSLTHEPSRTATLSAVQAAKDHGCLISYDPNYRPALWSNAQSAIEQMKQPLTLADVLKVSDEELPLLTGTSDLAEGSRLLADFGISLVLVTLGAEGVFYRMGAQIGRLPGVRVRVADTNGAGDTFLGAVLSRLCRRNSPLTGLSMEELEDILRFANRAAALTCSRRGAIPAMPTLNDLS